MRRFVILGFLVLFLSLVGLLNCKTVEAKQALIVIFEWFREAPYSETRSILENKGVKSLWLHQVWIPYQDMKRNLQ
jgi:hypothetical protein